VRANHTVVNFAFHPISGYVSGEYLIASISSKNPSAEAHTDNNTATTEIP